MTPSPNKIKLSEATVNDLETILQMAQQFYQIDSYPFDVNKYKSTFLKFIEDEDLGRFYLIKTEDFLIGYVIITFGFSFEYGGRDAFLDEIYIEEKFRSKGIGSQVMYIILQKSKGLGINALHLEVEQGNTKGINLYKKFNFGFNNRKLLTKIL